MDAVCTVMEWNNKLYFPATDGTRGIELWSYDGGSPAKMVYDLSPGAYGGTQFGPRSMAPFNGKLFYSGGNSSTTGIELASYDGVNPPSVVANVSPGNTSSNPLWLTPYGSCLFFTADSVVFPVSSYGYELYRYDGANAPRRIKIGSNAQGSAPRELSVFTTKAGPVLYFVAAPAIQGSGAWSTTYLYQCDAAGNYRIAKGTAGISRPYGLFVTQSQGMCFAAYTPANGFELYSYDGDTVTRLTDLAPGPGNGLMADSLYGLPWLQGPVIYHNTFYFPGSVNGANYQLYSYNPVAKSTALAAVIDSTGSAFPNQLYVYNDRLYFAAYSRPYGRELWSWNDTAASQVADIWPGRKGGLSVGDTLRTPGARCANFAQYLGQLYFAANDSVHGSEPWRLGIKTGGPSGVARAGWSGGMRLYPNPAAGSATLELSLQEAQRLSFTLTDAAGREALAIPTRAWPAGKTTYPISLHSLPPSIYYYRLTDETGSCLAAGALTKY